VRAAALLLLVIAACEPATQLPPPAPVSEIVPRPPRAPAASATASASVAAIAAPPPPPVSGDLPTAPRRSSFRRVAVSGKACKPEVMPAAFADTVEPGAPLVVWQQHLPKGSCLAFPSDDNIDVSLLLLEGTASVDGAAALAMTRPWAGVRARGGGVTVHGADDGLTRLVVVVSTAEGGPVACAGGRACRDGARIPSKPWSGPARTAAFDLAARPDLAWGGGAFHARIGWDEKPDDVASHVVDSLIFAPTAGVAEHVHDKQWECVVVLEGGGELVEQVDGAARSKLMVAGNEACIPAGRPHLFRSKGRSPFVGLQIYAPRGPEQRFVKLAGG
jgi:quercetin dioxygenase-like cupin family protein